jgi:hypothetical protein
LRKGAEADTAAAVAGMPVAVEECAAARLDSEEVRLVSEEVRLV